MQELLQQYGLEGGIVGGAAAFLLLLWNYRATVFPFLIGLFKPKQTESVQQLLELNNLYHERLVKAENERNEAISRHEKMKFAFRVLIFRIKQLEQALTGAGVTIPEEIKFSDAMYEDIINEHRDD